MFPSQEERIIILVKFIDKVKRSIKIETGELNCNIYNDLRIVESLEKAVANGVTIEVQASPTICVDEETKSNSILNLWKGGKLKLYTRKVRGDKIHRWIGDDCYIYSEDFHQPLADIQNRKVIVLSEEQEQYWAIKASEVFDGRIEDNEVKEVEDDISSSLILLTPSAIRKIYDFFCESGEDYNYKTKEQIDEARIKLEIEDVKLS